ncbi:flagellin [Photobacterium sp. 1_MG-2023]|uniref:flagellin n=1 Tax=Photobacterium sp. 1_MG-2023 TaxID=3062646 RepID=UPI0026E44913|nr:flagellin [Photobacterium sp. 1_MG-2023]MDO6705537.1 flagellin [Photobacterium sp. 1_MG-2023]
MVNSTAEIRQQSVSLLKNDKATITPPAQAGGSVSALKETQTVSRPAVVQGGYTAASELFSQGQEQVTRGQIAYQSLVSVGRDLQGMKKILTQMLGSSTAITQGRIDQLQRHHNHVNQALNAGRFDGDRVLNSQLEFQSKGEPKQDFTVNGLNLVRQRQQSEQLQLTIQDRGTVLLSLDATKTDRQLTQHIDRAVIPLGLRAASNENGDMVFSAGHADFQAMGQHVTISGQGHRYPAGQPNRIKLQPEPQGIEQMTLKLADGEQIRHTMRQVNQGLQQVSKGLDQLRAFQSNLDSQIGKAMSAQSSEQIDEKLQSMRNHQSFAATFQVVTAQANVHRHTAVALLKS